MPAKRRRDRRNLRRLNKTSRKREFENMRRWFPDRVTILAEGDSWFAYPKEWIIKGKPPNLIAHLSRWSHPRANFYSMASNGDEAVDMVSGDQKHDLVNQLRWHKRALNRKPIDLLLFSGGGNDVVGKNDFERFLLPYEPGFNAEECVNLPRLKRKSRQIALAYEELADIRDHYSPQTLIMTHTYDYPFPSTQGAVFLGGLIKTEAWMKRFMDLKEIAIPEKLQAGVIEIFMNCLGDAISGVARRRSKFIAVETRKTLTGKKQWLNEIHPTSPGFGELAEKIFNEMQHHFPTLKKS